MNNVQTTKKIMLKKRVFDSAWQIVKTEGMHQLNIRSVAKLSSCSVGSVYNAYGSFQDLQFHINSKILSILYQRLNEVTIMGIKNEKSLRTIFHELGMTYVEFGQNNRLLWKSLFEHFPSDSIPSWYKKHASEGIYLLCDRLSKAFGLSKKESKKIVGYFWASIHGVSSIFLNRKMEMVAELFSEECLLPYIEYSLDGLFKEVCHEHKAFS